MSTTRRLLLRWLPLLLPGVLARPAIAWPAPRKRRLNPFRVAGLGYYEVETAIRAMPASDPLRLVAEPTHPHDEFAGEIWHGAHQFGDVPRSDNRHLSRLLRQGAPRAGEV